MSAHLLLAEVLALPLEERCAILEKLRESIENPDSVRQSIEDAKFAEVERRWTRFESGQDRGIPWEEVHARVFGPDE